MNANLSDQELLVRYGTDGCETAFATMTQRHAGLVFATALRTVKNRALAEEVTQNVFTELAQRIDSLATSIHLPAWLHTVAYRKAIDALRKEARHRGHEPLTEMTPFTNPAAASCNWDDLAPLLDEAMHELNETDRTSLILRYFEDQPLKVVGDRMGVSEDAAQKRVSRALEELRRAFAKRQRAVETGPLSALMLLHAAPPVSQAWVAQLVSAASVGSTLVSNTAATAASASSHGLFASPHLIWSGLLAVALALTLHQSFRARQLAQELELSQSQSWQPSVPLSVSSSPRPETVDSPLTPPGRGTSSTDPQLRQQNEKLRSDLARLRSGLHRVRGEVDKALELIPPYQTFKATTTSTLHRDQALLMQGWTLPTGRKAVVLLRIDPTPQGSQMLIRTDWIEYAPELTGEWDNQNLLAGGEAGEVPSEPEKILSLAEAEQLLSGATKASGVELLSSPRIQTSSGVQASLKVTHTHTAPSGEEYQLGPSLNVLPTLSADGASVEVRVLAELSVPTPQPEIHWPE